jgi:predicted HTH domain antitoxin
MNIVLEIPESVASAIRIPEQNIEQEIRLLLATSLYSQGFLSFGKARELTGLSKYQFSMVLGMKKISRHYTEEELEDDIKYGLNY